MPCHKRHAGGHAIMLTFDSVPCAKPFLTVPPTLNPMLGTHTGGLLDSLQPSIQDHHLVNSPFQSGMCLGYYGRSTAPSTFTTALMKSTQDSTTDPRSQTQHCY